MTVASAGMTYRSINDLNNVADALHFTSKALSDRAASSISLISPIDCSEIVSSRPHNRPYEKLGRDRRPYAVSKLTSRSRKEHLANVAKDVLVSLQQLWKIGVGNDLLEIPQALCT